MSSGVITIAADTPVKVARETMREHGIRHLVVVENGELVGIVSERDLGKRGSAARSELPVREVMTPDPVAASPNTTLRQASNLMRGRTIGSLLVVEDGLVVGIVTTTDLLEQLGRGATRPVAGIEPPPLRRPPGSGLVVGKKAPRGPAGPRGGRRPRRTAASRAPLPEALPRAAKVVRGRTSEIPPPVHIRVIGAHLSSQDREYITKKLGRRLGPFASSIERASVRLIDVNGPKGGVDHKCVIKVVLNGLPSVVVERQDSMLRRSVDAAIAVAGLSVREAIRRRRMKPLRRNGRPAAATPVP